MQLRCSSTVWILIDAKIPVDIKDRCFFGENKTALHYAAERDDTTNIRVLLVNKAMIENGDHDKRTALHLAASHGRVEAVRVLVDARARIDSTDPVGKTALHYASIGDRCDVIEVLLGASARE